MALFPIHDLRRAADIRMRRRRAILLLAFIGLTGWTLLGPRHEARQHGRHDEATEAPPPSGAQGRSRSFRTASLVVDLSCAGSVTLLPRQGLGDQVLVSVRRGQEAALDGIGLAAPGRLTLDACDDRDADLTLRIAADRAFRIVQTGSTEIHGGSFGGAVGIVSSGSGSVALGGVGALDDVQSGGGDVTVGSVSGTVTARLSGSGDLRVRSGVTPELTAASSGSGDIDMGKTAIGGGRVTLDGSGDFAAEAVSGGGFSASTSNSGDITIARLNAGDVRLRGDGSGDIVVRGGAVGHLTADRGGSGDLVMDAAVADSRVSHDGSGDVRLPHAAGDPDD